MSKGVVDLFIVAMVNKGLSGTQSQFDPIHRSLTFAVLFNCKWKRSMAY